MAFTQEKRTLGVLPPRATEQKAIVHSYGAKGKKDNLNSEPEGGQDGSDSYTTRSMTVTANSFQR